MLRRDYILKLINDVFAAITKLLEKETDIAERQRQLEALYSIFGQDKDFFRQASEDEIISQVALSAAESANCETTEVSKDEMCSRLELVAYLLYADFKTSNLSFSLKKDVALRSLALYERVSESSDDFSLERLRKIDELKKFLSLE